MRHEHLINGYIRELERELNGQIIPYSINQICLQYYLVSNALYLLTKFKTYATFAHSVFNTPTNQYALYVHELDTKRKLNCKLINSINPSDATLNPGEHGYNSIFMARDIKLPPILHQHVTKHPYEIYNTKYNNTYNIFFKCSEIREVETPKNVIILFDTSNYLNLSTQV